MIANFDSLAFARTEVSLHLTTFCLQYRPTIVACVCIHLACKWSNWEIPVSTDGKHWWEYVDRNVDLQLLDDLTHEFLQILERTPSKLKRIRNWRAFQNSKKPKSDGADSAFQGASLDGLSSSFFPSTSDADLSSLGAGSFAAFHNMDAAAKACGYEFPPTLPSDFTLIKEKPSKQNGATFSRPQKVLTLEKYREKHAPDLTLQNGFKTETELYPALSPIAHHHKSKRSQAHSSQSESRRDKASSKKPKTQNCVENGSNEELKMRIKVSSESKEKHKDHHRHSKHSHQYTVNGRATTDTLLRPAGGDVSTVSSRKRPHGDSHNSHHHAKGGRGAKNALNAHFSDVTHDGTNGLPAPNGHTDYKNTFDMLDSLLNAQAMNL
uniref:Uncharacterized protein n=1 Tax=Knipowitschia caucasica TaxID=637954 RepID=A0AAV2LH44_KNICA